MIKLSDKSVVVEEKSQTKVAVGEINHLLNQTVFKTWVNL